MKTTKPRITIAVQRETTLRSILSRWPPMHDTTCRMRNPEPEDYGRGMISAPFYAIPYTCGLSEALETVGLKG